MRFTVMVNGKTISQNDDFDSAYRVLEQSIYALNLGHGRKFTDSAVIFGPNENHVYFLDRTWEDGNVMKKIWVQKF